MTVSENNTAANRNDQDDAPRFVAHRMVDLLRYFPGIGNNTLPLTIHQDVVDERAQAVVNYHTDFYSLYIVRRGRGTHLIDGTPYAIARGDVYVMVPGMRHRFTDCHDLVTDTLHFSPETFDAETRTLLAQVPGFRALLVEGKGEGGAESDNGRGGRWLHLTPSAYGQVAAQVAELAAEWQSGTPAGRLLTRALFLRLLVHLSRYQAESHPTLPTNVVAAPTAHEATIAQAVRYMDEHFADPLRVEQVAAHVFLSPDHFTSVFARTMGRTPRDYLRHLRVERAVHLLRTTDKSVGEIAADSGFGEATYLTRVLRTTMGKTPRQVRQGG